MQLLVRCAGGLLCSGAFRGRPLRGHFRPAVASAHGIFSRATSHFRDGDQRPPGRLRVREQIAEHLRTVPGVEEVALCEWPLMAGGSWNGFISVNGVPPGPVGILLPRLCHPGMAGR